MCLRIVVTTLLLAVGVSCQKLVWDSGYTSKSMCNAGSLLQGLDTFMVQGTASPADIMGLHDWSYVIDFFISYQPTAGNFSKFCEVIFHPISPCNATSKEKCFCTKIISNVAYFAVNLTAELKYSNAVLRAVWVKPNTKLKVQSDVTLPQVYKLSGARFAINNGSSSLVSSTCDVTVRNDRKSSFCCDTETTPNPCNPKLNFRGTWFSASPHDTCVEMPAYQGIFNYTLSVCGHDTLGYCMMNVLDGTTATATSVTRVTTLATATTGGEASESTDNDLMLILGLILGLAILFIVGCVILAFCCYKKKKEDSNIKTTENPEPSKEIVEETQKTMEETDESIKETAEKPEVEEGERTVI